MNTGENYGRTSTGELIGPYDTVAELDAELAAAEREREAAEREAENPRPAPGETSDGYSSPVLFGS